MSKLIVSIDGVVVKEAQLTKDRFTLGRRPYNDMVLDHLAVSGEHAMLSIAEEGQAVLEDLGSTNGTFVNGRAVRKQALADEDMIEIGRYRIRYLSSQGAATADEAAGHAEPSAVTDGNASDDVHSRVRAHGHEARVRVLTGSAAGRELVLTKAVTTLGKRGYSVAQIARSEHGFELSHVEGAQAPTVNGISVAAGPIVLQNRDRIAMGNVRLEYMDELASNHSPLH
ncbi:MAG: FHA domain-containing protein [Burkholderiaceae bacterium]